MKKPKLNRYYKQILIALLVISILPVPFLGYYVYALVQQQIDASYQTYSVRLENLKELFETSFGYVDVSLIRMGVKNTCQNAINRERKASNFQIFNDVQEELQLISNTEEYLNNVSLISRTHEWILGDTSFRPLDQYSNRDTIETLFAIENSSFWYTDGAKLYLCKKVPINATKGNGMLLAEFGSEDMLKELTAGEESGELVILDRDDQVMLRTGDQFPTPSAIVSQDEMRSLYHDTVLDRVEYDNHNYVILRSVAEHTGWTYALVIPRREIMENIFGISTIVFLVMAMLIMFDVLAIITWSRKLYQPIGDIDAAVKKGIRTTGKHSEEIDADTGLMDQVQYIVDQNVEMNQRLVKGQKNEKQLFLRRVYHGELMNPDAKLFEEHGFDIGQYRGGAYYVMAVKYHNQFENSDDRQLYLFALDNIVNELINDSETFPPVIIGSLMYLTCYVRSDSDESSVMKMQMLAIMIATSVKKYMKMNLNIGISQGFTDIQSIGMGIDESNKALQDAMGGEGEVNFYHSHHTTSESGKGYVARKKREQLLHYIDMGDREACKKELDIYIAGLADIYYYMFKLELCKLVSEILNIYNDYALVPDYDKVRDIIDYDIGKTIDTSERLKNYLWSYLLEPLFDTICDQAKERDMMHAVVEYLMDNLEKDIGLEECARHFNYNANYLSRWFKKKMGMTYTDFVISKKMELCKNMLVESDISVNELAEKFGYSSPQNFIRVFKKYTLMTPGQYRKIEREKLIKFQIKESEDEEL